MPAGFNKRFNIWRINYDPDDAVGGAVLTGTIIHYNVLGGYRQDPASQLLLQQGLETTETFSAVIVPGTLDIRKRDEVEVVAPRDDMNYGKRFRIINTEISHLDPRDPRNYLTLRMTRSVEAHGEYFQ